MTRLARSKTITRLPVLGFVVGGALALSGCFAASTTPVAFIEDCMTDRLDIVENVDWDGVKPRRMRIIDGNYRPMVMYLEKDRAYVLIIENVDATSHDIWSPGLLKRGVALESVQIGDKAPAKGCVNGVRVAARSEITVRFVAVWEGRYEFYDGGFPLFPGKLAQGVFHVVPPRVGLASK